MLSLFGTTQFDIHMKLCVWISSGDTYFAAHRCAFTNRGLRSFSLVGRKGYSSKHCEASLTCGFVLPIECISDFFC